MSAVSILLVTLHSLLLSSFQMHEAGHGMFVFELGLADLAELLL